LVICYENGGDWLDNNHKQSTSAFNIINYLFGEIGVDPLAGHRCQGDEKLVQIAGRVRLCRLEKVLAQQNISLLHSSLVDEAV
jgi:hypothetical protein